MNVQTVDYLSPTASKEFAKSLQDTGFAVLVNHPIQQELIKEIYQEWEQFFNSVAKNDYLYNRQKHDGYFPFASENAKGYDAKNLMEYYHIYTDGRYPSQVSDKALQLHSKLSQLAETVLTWLQAELPIEIANKLPEALPEMIRGTDRTVLRVIHYPPLQGSEDNRSVRAAAHEDINLITLLTAGTSSGLQLLDKNNQWHDVPTNAGNIVVNAGDMLQMCTEGFYRSTTHQVRNPSNQTENVTRMSMPLFVHPRDEVQLSTNHTALSYFLERMRENGVI